MAAISALINVMGRVVVLLLEAQIRLLFALGQALGAFIAALWQGRGPRSPYRHHRQQPRRPQRRYASYRR